MASAHEVWMHAAGHSTGQARPDRSLLVLLCKAGSIVLQLYSRSRRGSGGAHSAFVCVSGGVSPALPAHLLTDTVSGARRAVRGGASDIHRARGNTTAPRGLCSNQFRLARSSHACSYVIRLVARTLYWGRAPDSRSALCKGQDAIVDCAVAACTYTPCKSHTGQSIIRTTHVRSPRAQAAAATTVAAMAVARTARTAPPPRLLPRRPAACHSWRQPVPRPRVLTTRRLAERVQ